MFAAVEKFSGPAKILLGLIALTFVGFGASSVSSSSSDYIVKIGDRPITVQEVQRALQNAQASGNQNATEQAILQALQERAYLLEGAKLLGIGVSKEKLKQQKQILITQKKQKHHQTQQTNWKKRMKHMKKPQ